MEGTELLDRVVDAVKGVFGTEATPKREAVDIAGDFTELVEATAKEPVVRIIKPGWGSSGYYSRAVLERDAAKAFPAGTKMFWDHPTLSEEKDRPERSLRDLAGETTSAPWYDDNGPVGPGAYARIKVFDSFRDPVKDLAPHIGVSIRASGRGTRGSAEGRDGMIVEELTKGRSIDFVTAAGAGGQIVSLFESARSRQQEDHVDQKDLTEAQRERDEAKTALAEAKRIQTEEKARADRAEGALLLIEARRIADREIAGLKVPDAVRERIAASATANPPLKDGKLDEAALKEAVKTTAKSEVAYLTKALGLGKVRGVGNTEAPDEHPLKESEDRVSAAFREIGMTESVAKQATAGRN